MNQQQTLGDEIKFLSDTTSVFYYEIKSSHKDSDGLLVCHHLCFTLQHPSAALTRDRDPATNAALFQCPKYGAAQAKLQLPF